MELETVDQRTSAERNPVAPHPAANPARVKVLNPLSSNGPSMHAELLSLANAVLQVRVPRCVLVGSVVQVRTRDLVAFGEVRSSNPAGADYDIEVLVQRSS